MIKRLLIGLDVPPWLVGSVRAIILAGATAMIGAALSQAEVVEWGEYAWAAAPIIAGLRALEGLVDQLTTPNQNDTGGGL